MKKRILAITGLISIIVVFTFSTSIRVTPIVLAIEGDPVINKGTHEITILSSVEDHHVVLVNGDIMSWNEFSSQWLYLNECVSSNGLPGNEIVLTETIPRLILTGKTLLGLRIKDKVG